uniref:C2H2-type domain-containing protein n=1 Tax=Scylla olivacea TaxID=85551 RepID=A0A0P4WF23_SCYOL
MSYFTLARCPQCSFVATSRKQLRAHLSAHTGNRPHSCPYCDYRAACNKDLQKHIRTHTGEKPYQCELCPYRASDISNYRAHVKVKHKQRMQPAVAPTADRHW